jgi:hypothetical protein
MTAHMLTNAVNNGVQMPVLGSMRPVFSGRRIPLL